MVKNCPPGVICIDNVNIFLFIILILAFFLYFYKTTMVLRETIPNQRPAHQISLYQTPIYQKPAYRTSNNNQDSVLLNPFMPPLRPNQYLQQDALGIPVNVATQGENSSYKQIGILIRINGPEMILPLMGRSLITNRDKWQFYTMSDTNNSVKLPVSNRG